MIGTHPERPSWVALLTLMVHGPDTTCWQFDRNHETPLASPRTALRYAGSGTELLTRREPSAYTGDDFARPTGPVGGTTFLGRPAWTVEPAPPPHKPHPIQLVVDAETGIVLQQRNDGFGTVDDGVEFVVGEHLDPALFTWDGPTRSADDQHAEFEARWEADQIGMLARRPRSEQPWDLQWSETNTDGAPPDGTGRSRSTTTSPPTTASKRSNGNSTPATTPRVTSAATSGGSLRIAAELYLDLRPRPHLTSPPSTATVGYPLPLPRMRGNPAGWDVGLSRMPRRVPELGSATDRNETRWLFPH